MRRISEYLLIAYALTGTISIALSQAAFAFGGLVALLDRRRNRELRWVRTGFELPVLAWMGAAILATIFASDPAASFEKLRKLPLFALTLWAPAVVFRAWNLGRLFVGLLFAAGVTSLYGVLTFFIQGGPGVGDPIGGFHGFNLTNSGLLLLCTFPAILLTFCPTLSTSFRWGAGLSALSILATQFFGLIPGTWLGTTAGAVHLGLRRRNPWYAGIAVGVVAALLLVPGPFQTSAQNIFDPTSEQNSHRVGIWSVGMRLFAESPLSGFGLHDLRDQYLRVAGPQVVPEGHMYSIYVHVAASMGVSGLLALGWLVVAFFRELARARRRVGADPFLRTVVDGVEASLVAFLVAGLVEWNLGDSEILGLLCFLMGTAVAAGRMAPEAMGGAT